MKVIIGYSLGRSLKDAILLIVLCYCAFITKNEILIIRNNLYDVIRTEKQGKYC